MIGDSVRSSLGRRVDEDYCLFEVRGENGGTIGVFEEREDGVVVGRGVDILNRHCDIWAVAAKVKEERFIELNVQVRLNITKGGGRQCCGCD